MSFGGQNNGQQRGNNGGRQFRKKFRGGYSRGFGQQRFNPGRFDNISQYSNTKYKGSAPMVLGNVQNGGARGNGGNSTPRNRTDVVCFNCGQRGHIKRDCFKLNGGGSRGGKTQFGANNVAKVDGSGTIVLPDGTPVSSSQYTGGKAGSSSLKQPKN